MKYLKSLILLIGVLASLLTQVRSETITYMHTDALGTPVAATDESGNVLWREQYSPFGEKQENSLASQKNDVGYTGHQFDSDTGLVYMQARYYDPVIGRFYSNDPMGYRGVHSFNRYAYANNNPYRYTDPTGMCSEENKGSKVACNVEDKVTEILEPLMEDLLEALDLGATPEGERDPSGAYANEAESGSISGEILAIGILAAKAKLGKRKHRPKTRGANKKDKKQVDDAARQAGVQDRRGFSQYLHKMKKTDSRGASDNYSYGDLVEMAKKYKASGGK